MKLLRYYLLVTSAHAVLQALAPWALPEPQVTGQEPAARERLPYAPPVFKQQYAA